jgi:hypothetical protein
MAFRVRLVVFVLAMIAVIQSTATARELETVSPGATDRIAGIEARCPTFSWEVVAEAEFFELVAYRLPDGLAPGDLTDGVLAEAEVALEAWVPGGAAGWTPEAVEGLERGASYVWFVRAVYREDRGEVIEAGEWSQGKFFQISTLPSAAEIDEAVRRFLAAGGSLDDLIGDGEAPSTRRSTDPRQSAGEVHRGLGGSSKSVSTAKTAINGNVTGATGETYGVVGISNSPNGAGLAAGNTNGGADLVLDGLLDGDADTVVTQAGIDRASTGELWFSLVNSDTGVLSLSVEGRIVGDGSGLTSVDADTLDAMDGAAFATEAELAASGSAAVHWDNLTAVPTGLDDGDDNTTYTAGPGLTLSAGEFRAQGSVYNNVVIVAKSGGDFTEVQAAIDSISDAAAGNPYLVWVAPGEYSEEVTVKPHVHLQGAGQDLTVITSTISSSSWPPTAATLVLASDASLRDLTVGNSGTGTRSVALMATSGTTGTVVADVIARAQGGGTYNYAVALTGSGTEVTLHDVTALSENGSSENNGLSNNGGATVTLRGGSFTGRGGSDARGIYNTGSGSTLEATGVMALGEASSNYNNGLRNDGNAWATVHAGSLTGRGGSAASGVYNTGSGSTLEATGVTVLGDGGSSLNYGLHNDGNAWATVHAGSLTGRGGSDARGVHNTGSGSTLEATGVTVLGDGGSSLNYGLHNDGSAWATVRGGSYTGRGGSDALGIYAGGSVSTLETTGVAALGEGGSTISAGLSHFDGTSTVTQSVLKGDINSISGGSSGTVTVSNSRLVGTASGSVTCVLVTRGTTISTDGSTCP